jgi:hypothetical protein
MAGTGSNPGGTAASPPPSIDVAITVQGWMEWIATTFSPASGLGVEPARVDRDADAAMAAESVLAGSSDD